MLPELTQFLKESATATFHSINTEIEMALLHAIADDPRGYFWIEYYPTEYGKWTHEGNDFKQDITYHYRIGEIPSRALHEWHLGMLREYLRVDIKLRKKWCKETYG